MPFARPRSLPANKRAKGSHCSANPLFANIFAESCKIVNPKLFQLHGPSPSSPRPLLLRTAAALSPFADPLPSPPPLPPSLRSLSALCKRKYSIRTLNSITAFLINPKYPFPKEGRLPLPLPPPTSSSNELDLFRLSLFLS